MNERTILLALGESLVLRARVHSEQGATGCLPTTSWSTSWPLRLDKLVGASVTVTAEGVGDAIVRAEHVTDRETIEQQPFKELFYEAAKNPGWATDKLQPADVYREGSRPVVVLVPSVKYDIIRIKVYDPADGPPRLSTIILEVG